jgi:hypothetical protein
MSTCCLFGLHFGSKTEAVIYYYETYGTKLAAAGTSTPTSQKEAVARTDATEGVK